MSHIALRRSARLIAALTCIGAALSTSRAQGVNAECPPGLTDRIEEWEWQWDDRTEVGEFEVPLTYYDRRHGRTYERGAMTLRYQLRIPEDRGRIRGLLILVPGLDQHSGRFRHLVDRFEEEFIIASCDTRFMGRSHPELVDLGLGDRQPRGAHRRLQNIRKFFYIVYDLDEFLHEVLPRELSARGVTFEDHPLILLGHSLGGLVALDYVLGNDQSLPPENLVGVILSAPAFRPPRGVPNLFQEIVINYNYHVNASFGSHTEERTAFLVLYEQTRNVVMTPLFYLISLTRVPVDSSWAARWVTDDPWEQIGFQTDPLTIRRNPLNFIYQVQEHMLEIRDLDHNMIYPYLLFYSPGDQIVNPAGAIRFATRTSGNHPLNRVYPVADTFSHELFRARPAVRNRLFDVAEEWVDTLLQSIENGGEAPGSVASGE